VTWSRIGFLAFFGVLVAALSSQPGGTGVELGYLNQTHTNLDVEIPPIREGPLAIQLSSPSHRLTLHRNLLVLGPSAGGEPDAWGEAEIEGAGNLVAKIEGGSMATQFQDRVIVPRQVVQLRGKVRVARNAESYTLRLVDGPPNVPVRIRSGVIDRCVAICNGLGIFTAVNCGRLEKALSTVHVPLRSEETALRLPRARLTEGERAYLDRFVSR
jgi:hypothetical protein